MPLRVHSWLKIQSLKLFWKIVEYLCGVARQHIMTPRFRTPSCTVAAGWLRPLAFLSCFLLSVILALAAPVKFDIPAQPAPAALQLFMKQSGASVMYSADQLGKVRTAEVKSELEPLEALQQLLAGTDFIVRQEGPTNFVIEPVSTKPGSVEGSVQSESGRPVAGARVSLVGSNQTVLTDKHGRFVFEDVEAGPQSLAITAEGMLNTKVTDVNVKPGHCLTLSTLTVPAAAIGAVQLEDYIVSARKDEGVIELDPYQVDGTRTKPFSTANIDLARTRDDILPFQTYSGDEIIRSGSMDMPEFFRNRMSQNYISVIQEENPSNGRLQSPSLAQNQFNLANGAGSTGVFTDPVNELVVLVNGRRLPNREFGAGAQTTGNLRGIPLTMVDRVELLTSAAGAIYGAGATGGVINIITKQNYRGGSITSSYETPVDGHAMRRSITADYSMPLGEKFSLRLGAWYSDTEPLVVQDRADVSIERYRALIQARQPSLFSSNYLPPLGALTNIRSASGAGLFGLGTATITSVPAGYTGGQGLAPFLSRQGVFDLTLAGSGSNAGYGQQSQLGATNKNVNFTIGLDYTLNPTWRITLEYQNVKETLKGKDSNESSWATISASAPSNPFGQSVVAAWYDPRLELPALRHEAKTTSSQCTLSIRGEYHNWRALVDAAYTSDGDTYQEVEFLNPLTPTGASISMASAIALGLYNPFVDMRTTAPAGPAFYEEYVQKETRQGGKTDTIQVNAKLSGEIFDLPAGKARVTVGAEWLRRERLAHYYFESAQNSRTRNLFYTYEDQVFRPKWLSKGDTYSIYTESVIPLISAEQNILGIKKLECFISGRYGSNVILGSRILGSEFEESGTAFRQVFNVEEAKYRTSPFLYVYGLGCEMPQGFAIRVSESVGYKPPTFGEVSPGLPPTGSISVIDRRYNTSVVLSPSMRLSGGNLDLKPETTRSRNIGMVLQSKWLPGFRASVDYVENLRDDAIASISPQELLNLEAGDPVMAARIHRDATGAITFVDARNINFRQIGSKVLDLTIEQRVAGIGGGQVVVSVAATKNLEFMVQTSAVSSPIQQVRNPSAVYGGSFIEWNGNAQVRWQTARWTLGWSGRFFDDVLVRPENYIAQGRDRLGRAMDHDVFAAYRFPRSFGNSRLRQSMFSNSAITIGIKNLFDRAPRFYATNNQLGLGTYPGDSLYGRRVWIQYKKEL